MSEFRLSTIPRPHQPQSLIGCHPLDGRKRQVGSLELALVQVNSFPSQLASSGHPATSSPPHHQRILSWIPQLLASPSMIFAVPDVCWAILGWLVAWAYYRIPAVSRAVHTWMDVLAVGLVLIKPEGMNFGVSSVRALDMNTTRLEIHTSLCNSCRLHERYHEVHQAIQC
jgi:hypothetical protein